MKIAVVMHVPFEGPAMIAEWAEARGHAVDLYRMFAAQALPAAGSFDLLVSMGGPMGTRDAARMPFLAAEIELMRDAIAHGKKVLGVCLGAQLLAHCLGAEVTKNKEKEIGWMTVERTGRASVFAVFPPSMHVLHWHGDTFALPAGASLELSSAACTNQAFYFEKGPARAAGLQFHLEMTPAAVTGILENCAQELLPGPFVHSAERIQADATRYMAQCQKVLSGFLDGFSRL